MNIHQRVFESYDRTKMFLKLRENLNHKRKLDHIKHRQSQQPLPFRRSLSMNKYSLNLVTTFKKNQDDSYLRIKLSRISSKTPHPVINDYFLKSYKRHKIQSTLKRKEDTMLIQKQNFALFRRMAKAQSFINPKEVDKKFQQNHNKLKIQMSKVRFPPNPSTRIKHLNSQSLLMQKKNETKAQNNEQKPDYKYLYNLRDFNHFTLNGHNYNNSNRISRISISHSNSSSIHNTHINMTNVNKSIFKNNNYESSLFFTEIKKKHMIII